MDKNGCKEMQNEELEAIQAIYMDDFIQHSKNKKGTPEIALKLTPLQSMNGKDVHARLDLRVKFTSKYPYDAPILKLENAKGVSDEMLTSLLKELNDMALSLCGEVMVLPLAQHCQSFLHKVNTPTLSFFEQMLANQQKQEKEYQQKQQKIQEAELAENKEYEKDVMRQVKEELQKREEVMKQEKRKRQISQSSPQNSMSLSYEPFNCSRSRQKKFTVMTFRSKGDDRKVFCSTCIGHFYPFCCLMNGIDEVSGKQMSIGEWKIKYQMPKKKVHFVDANDQVEWLSKQVQSIEQEFYFLKSKISFKGILQYHNLETDVGLNEFAAKLLMDPVTGPSLSQYIQDDGQPIIFVQNIAKQLVDIFVYLHGKSVTHRDLNLLNTFIDSQNKVVISGYAVMRRISDICLQIQVENDVEVDPLMMLQSFQKQIKTGKSGDVFNFGVILLSLHTGYVVTEYPVCLSKGLPSVFLSFLEGCLNDDENQRLSFQQLSKHSFLFDKIISNPIVSQDGFGEKKSKHNVSFSKSTDNIIPFLGNHTSSGRSRLLQEFEVIQYLGEGGFGSVIQVRNKLDSNYYAIKRIPLNPRSFNLNKKITREVKLLSRLNHENVVRYYNSWIEAEDIHSSETDGSSTTTTTNESQSKVPANSKFADDSLLDLNRFEMPPEINENGNDGSWCNNDSYSKRNDSSTSSSSNEVSSENVVRKKSLSKKKNSPRYSRSGIGESSEGIVFQMEDSMVQFGDMLDSEDEDSTDENFHTPTSTINTTKTDSETSTCSVVHQFLYIQMEFCERLTLRNTIDEEELCKKPERVWRLFREIVEGLHHVHAQGIIHRDLKPVNIFMDSSDRIKIGDFGLATAHTTTTLVEPDSAVKKSAGSVTDDRMTGKVGTALYVAPELGGGSNRVKFSHKVDMYSLGIILFEMFYKPLKTGMERVKILGTLRTENVVFPEDFSLKKFAREQHLISWLLNHDSEKRPTTEELLNSGYVPPKLEDRQLDELLRHTLSQNNSTRYQRLMASLFTQPVSPVFDQIYDSECHGKNEAQVIHSANLLQYVEKIISNVFIKHGAIFLRTPLLMPKFKLLEDNENIASFIDQSGLPVCLPYESRLSFARYVSRNNISNMRRYCFNQLYRKQKLLGAHPLVLQECCFDIIADDNTSLIPEGEIVLSVYEIINEFPGLIKSNFYLRINHLNILKAIFNQNNLSETVQKEVYKILETTRNNSDRDMKIKECLLEFGLAEHIIQRIFSLALTEVPFSKAKELLQPLRKTKANISSLAKQALQDLDKVVKCLHYFGVELPVYLSTSLVINSQFYDGIVFQFVANNKRKKKYGGVDILAAGGRYDKLIESVSQYAETSSLPSAVGVSLSVDKILLSALEESNIDKDYRDSACCWCDVIVCSVTNLPKLNGLLEVLQELWSAGIKAALFSYDLHQDYTLEEIQEYCKENFINYFVILKHTDLEFVKVRNREKDWFIENRIARKDLCEYLLQRLSTKNESVKTQDTDTSVKATPSGTHGGDIFFNFTLVGFDRFVEANRRRKLESTFLLKYKEELHQMFGNKEIQVVIGKLEMNELKLIAGVVEFNSTPEKFDSSLDDLQTLFNVRGTHIKKICSVLQSLSSCNENNAITILFSALTETYKVII